MVLPVRQELGGLGNLLFREAYLRSCVYDAKIPDVYVQDYRLWSDKKFLIKQSFSRGIQEKIYKVGVHIRRGDYLKAEDFHTNLWKTTSYYNEAIRLFPDEHFLVFCLDRQSPEQDEADREWCRDTLRPLLGEEGGSWEMAPIHEDETEDLNMLASCNWIIGANSSFSWWGAFLGDHAKVVMPREERWFTDKVTRCHLLPEWTKL